MATSMEASTVRRPLRLVRMVYCAIPMLVAAAVLMAAGNGNGNGNGNIGVGNGNGNSGS